MGFIIPLSLVSCVTVTKMHATRKLRLHLIWYSFLWYEMQMLWSVGNKIAHRIVSIKINMIKIWNILLKDFFIIEIISWVYSEKSRELTVRSIQPVCMCVWWYNCLMANYNNRSNYTIEGIIWNWKRSLWKTTITYIVGVNKKLIIL